MAGDGSMMEKEGSWNVSARPLLKQMNMPTVRAQQNSGTTFRWYRQW